MWKFDGVTSRTGAGWDSRLGRLLRAAGADVTIIDPSVDDPLSLDADGHVLSGGATAVATTPGSVRSLEHATHLVRLAVHTGMPVVGVCLGMQMLAAAISGRTISGPCRNGLEAGVVTVDGDGAMWQVATFHAHGVDHDFAATPGVRVTATNAHSGLQAFEYHSVTGVQFHPEFDRLDLAEAIAANPDWVPSPNAVIDAILAGPDVSIGAVHRWLLGPLGLGTDSSLPSPPLAA